MSRKYMTVKDVAVRYGGAWSEWQVREMARTCRIPHRRHPGAARLLFLEADLDAWDDGARLEVKRLANDGRVVRPVDGRAVARRAA